VTVPHPGYDEIILTAPGDGRLCGSLACTRAGRAADVIVTYGVLADPGFRINDRSALWPECWGVSYPGCADCWKASRQVAVKYRPGLVIRDLSAPATPQPPRERP
jgi:hypothetical protein